MEINHHFNILDTLKARLEGVSDTIIMVIIIILMVEITFQ